MKRLAIIPARAGSKRIPRKNIRDFCGKPMIAHVIDAVAGSAVFSAIHVSTDSDEVASVAEKCGYKPDFMRPETLADDHTSMMEVLKFTVEEYQRRGKTFDTVALIFATSPLLDPEDLQTACDQFEQSDQEKALLAVTSFPVPIERAFRMQDKSGDLLPADKEAMAIRTQDLQPAYHDAGMFAFYTPDYILNSSGAGDYAKFRGYIVPASRVTDIDWPEDWDYAEQRYRAFHDT